MRKNYYTYNPDTGTYERVRTNFAQRFLTSLRRALFFIIFGCGSFILFHIFVDKPSVEKLESENSEILAQYKILSKRLDNAMLVLQDIQQRDDNLYRVMLDAEPVSADVRNAGYGGTNRYDELLKMDNSELLVETTQKIDLLEKQLYMQIKSFDEIVALDKDSKTRLRHTPAIQPIANRDLKRTASGYGYRIDPVYNVRTFHKGMDFSC
ncbi:MAG: M23 family peptidase, partial [Bacteroidaceae bacterium]|nr:M23 family peptidase [Bacteroidaceae bacterium]